MKLKSTILLLMTGCLVCAGPVVTKSVASEPAREVLRASENQPAAFLPESQYTFEPVLEGTVVSHTFILKNQGTAPLELQKVRTG